MTAMHLVGPALSVAAFISGLISAGNWLKAAGLRASTKQYGMETAAPDQRQATALVATIEMVYQSNAVNMTAARWSAITVLLTGAQSLAAAFLP